MPDSLLYLYTPIVNFKTLLTPAIWHGNSFKNRPAPDPGGHARHNLPLSCACLGDYSVLCKRRCPKSRSCDHAFTLVLQEQLVAAACWGTRCQDAVARNPQLINHHSTKGCDAAQKHPVGWGFAGAAGGWEGGGEGGWGEGFWGVGEGVDWSAGEGLGGDGSQGPKNFGGPFSAGTGAWSL